MAGRAPISRPNLFARRCGPLTVWARNFNQRAGGGGGGQLFCSPTPTLESNSKWSPKHLALLFRLCATHSKERASERARAHSVFQFKLRALWAKFIQVVLCCRHQLERSIRASERCGPLGAESAISNCAARSLCCKPANSISNLKREFDEIEHWHTRPSKQAGKRRGEERQAGRQEGRKRVRFDWGWSQTTTTNDN